jgi:hypothetical protein
VYRLLEKIVFVKPKDGGGPGDPTGINIKNP